MSTELYKKQVLAYLKERRALAQSGRSKETTLRPAFHALIKAILSEDKAFLDFRFETEITDKGSKGNIYYDAQLLYFPTGERVGVLEDKDEGDDLDIWQEKKRKSGYDFANILFEDGQRARLVRGGVVVAEAQFYSPEGKAAGLGAFGKLLFDWLSFKTPKMALYENAQQTFSEQVPILARQVRGAISQAREQQERFELAFQSAFGELKKALGPSYTEEGQEQLLTQHILTSSFFKELLGGSLLRYNAIAQALDALEQAMGRQFDAEIERSLTPFYKSVCARAGSSAQKGELLTTFYESFYRAYDPQAASKLGIFYTPREIVDFIVQGCQSLLKEHFGCSLGDKGVHVLDPCAGTGNFVIGLLRFLAAQVGTEALQRKYSGEIHADELSLLAYYVGLAHIETSYSDLLQEYGEGLPLEDPTFTHMALADTIDNDFATARELNLAEYNEGKRQHSFEAIPTETNMASLSAENAALLRAQNETELLVILGNPPYKAQQESQNQNNANRSYKNIDERIKRTYSAASSAQKPKYTNMYVRFLRWASDRLGEEGILAFVTDSSFLGKYSFDGFRACAAKEFTHIYSLDLGGNVNDADSEKGSAKNVFNVKVGVAVTFFVRAPRSEREPGIRIAQPFAFDALRSEKLSYLQEHAGSATFKKVPWQLAEPNKRFQWLEQPESDFKELAPLVDKASKLRGVQARGIFSLFSLGTASNRDSWAYDHSAQELETKTRYDIESINAEKVRFFKLPAEEQKQLRRPENKEDLLRFLNRKTKWDRDSTLRFLRDPEKKTLEFSQEKITTSLYRPFQKRFHYFDNDLNNVLYQMPSIYPLCPNGPENGDKDGATMAPNGPMAQSVNEGIGLSGIGSSKEFHTLATLCLVDLHLTGDTQYVPLSRYEEGDEGLQKVSNLSTRGKEMFPGQAPRAILGYVYALLHHPSYKERYALDLKIDLPRVPVLAQPKKAIQGDEDGQTPVYKTISEASFSALSALGEQLLTLHQHWDEQPPLESFNTSGSPQARQQRAYSYKLGHYAAVDWAMENNTTKSVKEDAKSDVERPESPLYTDYGYKNAPLPPAERERLGKVAAAVAEKTLDLVDEISKVDF